MDTEKYILGALDISYSSNLTCGFAVIVIYNYTHILDDKINMLQQKTIYIKSKEVCFDTTKQTSFADREYKIYCDLLDAVKIEKPSCYPNILFIDGNGIFSHTRNEKNNTLIEQIEIFTNIPTISISKKYFISLHISKLEIIAHQNLKNKGDYFYVKGNDKTNIHTIMKSSNSYCSKKHIYITVAHKISLEKATEITQKLLKNTCFNGSTIYPIHTADDIGRKLLVKNNKYIEREKQKCNICNDNISEKMFKHLKKHHYKCFGCKTWFIDKSHLDHHQNNCSLYIICDIAKLFAINSS
jgi:deoxyinosine 3'endonuclease (endonuclease V)